MNDILLTESIVKLEPYGIYNIDRNYQQLNKIKWRLTGIEFQKVINTYFLRIEEIKVIFKNEYNFDTKAYSFIGSNILLELNELNTSINNNLIYLDVKNDKLSIVYNNLNMLNDNSILIGYVINKKVEKV